MSREHADAVALAVDGLDHPAEPPSYRFDPRIRPMGLAARVLAASNALYGYGFRRICNGVRVSVPGYSGLNRKDLLK